MGRGGRKGWRAGVAGARVRSWRLAAVVADTWKGFSNLAGLSSTVTFVTVTHAILEPQPSTAKIKRGGRVCGKNEGVSQRPCSHARMPE